MHGLEQMEADDGDTVFRDVIMLALAGFVAMVILLLPHLNPPGETAEETTQPPGNVIVEVRWPDELDSDVDLWVYLLRDDLGKRADATGLNYEISYSRGIPAGEYTINVHLYRNASNVFPIPVTVVTSVKRSPKESARQVLTSKVELVREGEEVTVYRFRLSEDGSLVPGSVHSLSRNLRAWRSS